MPQIAVFLILTRTSLGPTFGLSTSVIQIPGSAVSFAKAFYRALGAGRDAKTAFELGCSEMCLTVPEEQEDTVKLLAVRVNPEEILFIG